MLCVLPMCNDTACQTRKQDKKQRSSHIHLPLKILSLKKIGYLFFIVIIFLLSSWGKNKEPLLSACLTHEEKKDLDYFFRFLIFENYGGFVLFGSKPLCEMHVPDTRYDPTQTDIKEWISAMPEEERLQFEMIQKNARERTRKIPKLKRNPYQGLLALEKVLKNIKMKNYILRIIPRPISDGQQVPSYDVMLVNIQQTAFVLAVNYAIFKEAAGMDFHPLQAVFELQDPESVLWKNIFSIDNHTAKGLLYGFGLKNSIFGNWYMRSLNQGLDLPSDKYKETVVDYLKNISFNTSRPNHKTPFCEEPVTHPILPLFGRVQSDEIAEKYTKEKAAIEKIYAGKDLVEVTLSRLAILE